MPSRSRRVAARPIFPIIHHSLRYYPTYTTYLQCLLLSFSESLGEKGETAEFSRGRARLGGSSLLLVTRTLIMSSSSSTQQQGEACQDIRNNGNAFSQHVQEDPALNDGAIPEQDDDEGMSFVAKTLVYLGFPLFMGTCGLYIGYLKTIGNDDAKIDFDTDFVFPFLLALALVVVISIQTRGFTQKKIKPLVQWPKVKRKKKIIRKRIIVDDDGNEIEDKKNN